MEVENDGDTSKLESLLVESWRGILGVEDIGVHDDIFSLGADSIDATLFLNRIQQQLGQAVSHVALHEARTVSRLAAHLLQHSTTAGSSVSLETSPKVRPSDSAINYEGRTHALSPAVPRLIPSMPRDDSTRLPLSYCQQRLWFLARLDPSSAAYHVLTAIQVQGTLNTTALRQAFGDVLRRHESLRITVEEVDGLPRQRIGSAFAPDLPVIDLRSLPLSQRSAQAQRLAAEEFRRPFDLEAGPLWRACLLQLTDAEHLLLISIHHLVSDGWSRGILLTELWEFYTARVSGRLAQLPELTMQYVDYACWQRQRLGETDLNSSLLYWKEQLAGVLPLDIPTDRPRPPVQSTRGARRSFLLPTALVDRLRVLGLQERATLFMTLLAGFEALLHRYSGQDVFCVGIPIAGRVQAELEPLIGFFANTLALRADLTNQPTFRVLVGRVRNTVLAATAHQELPFEQLVEALQPRRDLSRSPLFQVMLVLQNTPAPPAAVPGLRLISLDCDNGTAKFELTLFLVESEEGLRGQLEYNTDLFDSATMQRMADHFRTLLEGAAAAPDRALAELPLLTEAERRCLLVEWNDTAIDYPAHRGVQRLFESAVERTPDAVAVVRGNDRLTFRELNARANQLAHYLRSRGVRPEVVVGICVERSLEMVVGILGVLKAGGAYLPLDPTFPDERLSFMLGEVHSPLLLTQKRFWARLSGCVPEVLCLDADWEQVDRQGKENPEPTATADNLAYVIYTSGSTGQPKGSMILHRGLANYLHWCTQAYDVAAGEGAPVQSSIAFDLTVTSLFAPLLVGRRVELLAEGAFGIEVLSKCLRRGGNYSLVKLTPAHLELLSRQLGPEEVHGRTRAFIIGGENLTAEQIAFWERLVPHTVLINEYGPTETVVGCCVYRIPPGRHTSGSIPIGRPIANTQLYVLDRHLQPVPVGVPGELHIGGAGVARGYLNRPELTAEKFIANPFSSVVGSKLYKTGDLARWLSDGNLEFLGRLDDQVKVRGYRIEPGEIVAELARHPAVRGAAVVAREDVPGDRRLVAYFLPTRTEGIETSELRRFLRARLPEYMVPSAFVPLASLPLTPNGKVDRKALPIPGGPCVRRWEEATAPTDDLERLLAGIWEKVLSIRPVGVTQHFFDDLGGHSLLAVGLFAEIEKVTKKRLPLASLFQGPTVRELARLLRQESWSPPWSPLVAIQPEGSRPPFFCVHGGEGNILLFRSLAGHLGMDQPFFGLQAPVLDGEQRTLPRIEELAERYLREIRRTQSVGPYHLGGFCVGGLIAYEMARLLEAEGQSVALLALLDTVWWGVDPVHLSPLARAWYRAWAILPRASYHWRNRFRSLPLRRKLAHYWHAIGKRYQPEALPSEKQEEPDLNDLLLGAGQRYMPGPYGGKITYFRSGWLNSTQFHGPQWLWRHLAAGGMEVHLVPGDHRTLLQEPHVQELARKLGQCLDRARGTALLGSD